MSLTMDQYLFDWKIIMLIDLQLNCKHFSVNEGKEQKHYQKWRFMFKSEDILLIVLNQYHPYVLIEFKTNQTRFAFETMEESALVYEYLKNALAFGKDGSLHDLIDINVFGVSNDIK